MPHFKEFLDPNFLSNIDFINDKMQYVKKIFTIKNVTTAEAHNGKGVTDRVVTMNFEESKPLILSNRNFKTMLRMTKKVNTDDWNGLRIELYIAENVKAFGQMWDVIRISNRLIEPAKKVDYSEKESMLKNCLTLDELRTAFLSLTKDEQTALFSLKEQLKTKLS